MSAKWGCRPHVALSLALHAAQPSPLASPRQEGELAAVGPGWCLSLKLQRRSSPRSRGKGPQRAGGECMHLLSRWPQLVSLAPLHQPARKQSLDFGAMVEGWCLPLAPQLHGPTYSKALKVGAYASASTRRREWKCSEVGQASSPAHEKGRLLMQNRKENTGKIGTHRGVAAVTVY